METSPAPRPAQGHIRNVEAIQAHTKDRRQSQPTPANSRTATVPIEIHVTPMNLRDPVNTK